MADGAGDRTSEGPVGWKTFTAFAPNVRAEKNQAANLSSNLWTDRSQGLSATKKAPASLPEPWSRC